MTIINWTILLYYIVENEFTLQSRAQSATLAASRSSTQKRQRRYKSLDESVLYSEWVFGCDNDDTYLQSGDENDDVRALCSVKKRRPMDACWRDAWRARLDWKTKETTYDECVLWIRRSAYRLTERWETAIIGSNCEVDRVRPMLLNFIFRNFVNNRFEFCSSDSCLIKHRLPLFETILVGSFIVASVSLFWLHARVWFTLTRIDEVSGVELKSSYQRKASCGLYLLPKWWKTTLILSYYLYYRPDSISNPNTKKDLDPEINEPLEMEWKKNRIEKKSHAGIDLVRRQHTHYTPMLYIQAPNSQS